jgi:hypothetical protein
MKIEKVTFQTTYNIGPFLNVKVGFEAQLSGPYWEGSEADGHFKIESPEEVLSNLRKLADEWHKKEYPHLYQEENKEPWVSSPTISKAQTIEFRHIDSIPIISKDSERLEIEIDNAQTLEDLKKIKDANLALPHPILLQFNAKRDAITKSLIQ